MTDRKLKTNLAELAAQALSGEAPALEGRFDARTGQVAAIAQALRVRGRHRWIVRHVVAAALVAAPAAAALVLWISTSPRQSTVLPAASTGPPSRSAWAPAAASVEAVQGSIQVAGVARDLMAGDEIAAGTDLSISQTGRAVMRLSTGTRITLSEGGAARVSELGALTRFDLDRGKFGAEVVKLVPGERFLVVTPDAEIEVKGTRFDVGVAPTASHCGVPTRTSVDVRSGVVAVRFASRELRLTAGEHWPDCGAAEAGPPRAAAISEMPQTRRHASHARPTDVAAVPSSPRPSPSTSVASPVTLPGPSSTLSQQNDLLAAALAAERRGDLDEAARWLDQLMSGYPGSQLAESAQAARRRLEAVRASKAADQ